MLHRLGWFLIWVGLLSTILAWVLAAPPMCVRYGIGVVIFSSFVTYWTRWQPVSELYRLRALCEKQLRMLEAAAVAAGVHKPAFTPTAGFDMTGGITLKPTPEQAAALMNTVSSNGRIEPHVQHVRHTPQPIPDDTAQTAAGIVGLQRKYMGPDVPNRTVEQWLADDLKKAAPSDAETKA